MTMQEAINSAWAMAAQKEEGLPRMPALQRLAAIKVLLAPWVKPDEKP